MENRDRDKVSKNIESTSSGDINRKTSQNIGHDKSESSVDFGEKIGRSEGIGSESSRSGGSIGEGGMQGGSSGRSSDESLGDVDRNDLNKKKRSSESSGSENL